MIRLLNVGMPHNAPDPRGLRVWLSTGAHHLNGDRSSLPVWHAGRSYLDRDLHGEVGERADLTLAGEWVPAAVRVGRIAGPGRVAGAAVAVVAGVAAGLAIFADLLVGQAGVDGVVQVEPLSVPGRDDR